MNLVLSSSSALLLAAIVLRVGGARSRTACIGAASIALAGAAVLGVWGAWQGGALAVGALTVLGSTRVRRAPLTAGRGPRLLRGSVLGAALAFSAVLAALAVLFPIFSFPTPTGPHQVGTRHFLTIDSTRPERLTPDPTDHRVVPLRVWYPTEADTVRTAAYWPDAGPRGAALARELGLPGVVFSHLDRVSTHARPNTPVLPSAELLPVVLFSHGYAGAPDQSTFLMEDLASHGYVVVSVGHPYEALPLPVPSGAADLIPQTPEPTPALVEESLRLLGELQRSDSAGRTRHGELLAAIAALPRLDESFAVWVADGRFAMDWIAGASGPGGALGGRVDASRIGVFGHSFGGAMAAEVCRADTRCAGGINIDGAQLGTVARQGLEAPFLFLYSEPSLWINHSVAEKSAAAVQAMIPGSAHLDFTDLPSITPLLRLASMVSPIPQAGPIHRDELVSRSREVVRGFFDRHLRRRKPPTTRYPEIPGVVFESGSGG